MATPETNTPETGGKEPGAPKSGIPPLVDPNYTLGRGKAYFNGVYLPSTAIATLMMMPMNRLYVSIAVEAITDEVLQFWFAGQCQGHFLYESQNPKGRDFVIHAEGLITPAEIPLKSDKWMAAYFHFNVDQDDLGRNKISFTFTTES